MPTFGRKQSPYAETDVEDEAFGEVNTENREAAKELTRNTVLAWLIACSDNDALWFLTHAAKERSDAFRAAARASAAAVTGKDNADSLCSGPSRAREALNNEHAKTYQPIVQFSSSIYFCLESDGYVRLDLIRRGNLEQKSEVRYNTVDITATAGVKYSASTGTLVFEPGMSVVEVDIPLIDDDVWDTLTEFKVILSDPSGCVLGLGLHRTVVYIMDNEAFPSNKHREETLSALSANGGGGYVGAKRSCGGGGPGSVRERLEALPKWSLLMEYFKLNFGNPVVRRGTIKALVMDQLHNLYFILILVMNTYMVDVIFSEFEGQVHEGMMRLIVLIALTIVPFACLHILDPGDFGGASRMMLQKALVRKFLNYTEESRNSTKHADLVMAMIRDSHSLVHDGYMKFLDQFKVMGKFVFIVMFQVGLQYWQGTITVAGFAVTGLFPVLLFAFRRLRSRRITNSVARMNIAQNALVNEVDRVVTNFRLISDYNRRLYFINKVVECCKDYNVSVVHATTICQNNQYAGKWLTTIFVAAYTLLGGIRVLEDPAANTLGVFLANIAIISSLGDIFETININFTEMEAALPALLNIVTLLNLPVDLHHQLEINRHLREATNERRTQLEGEELEGCQIDYLPIELDLSKMGTPLPGAMSVLQGSFVALVGPMGGGKTTLLKILGGVIILEPGCKFIPSHLRLLHVTTEATFFLGTLYENLTFGCAKNSPDRDLSRVLAICRRLGLSEKALRCVEQGGLATNPDAEVVNWGDLLSHTDKSLCQLARGLIANPEILCVHKPTMPHSDSVSRKVLNVLKEFCTQKGVELDPATRHLRRPRTCIVTCSRALGVEIADEVFLVDLAATPGLRQVDRHGVTDLMLG